MSDILADVPLFALLDDGERAELLSHVASESFPAGKTVFSGGDPGDCMYVLKSGKVEIFFRNDTGERILLETALPGDFFGEISLLDGGPRTASAVVVEDAEALVIQRGALDHLFNTKPTSALDVLAATGKRLRESARLLRNTASRNANEQVEDKRSTAMRVADWISAFSGSLEFLYLHIVWFTVWIVMNVKPLNTHRWGGFDPFPFGLLTMTVSLEAIILSVFVLLSQNRQVERDRVRNDIEYDVNLKAELEIRHLHVKVDHIHGEILGRLAAIEKKTGPKT